MAKKKFGIEFDGFEEVMARLNNLGADVRKTTEKALNETHNLVTKKAEEAIRPHKLTGQTERSLQKKSKIEWAGTVAFVEVGFDISNGGLASIFLMYGTPRMKKDQKMYNAFYGKQTHDEIMKLQEDIYYEEIRRFD